MYREKPIERITVNLFKKQSDKQTAPHPPQKKKNPPLVGENIWLSMGMIRCFLPKDAGSGGTVIPGHEYLAGGGML